MVSFIIVYEGKLTARAVLLATYLCKITNKLLMVIYLNLN